jgi:glycosyltransferase involved in cell wall biosynthesis
MLLDGFASWRARRQLQQIAEQKRAEGIHAIAHMCWDTVAAYEVSERMGIPFYLSVHDDPAYILKDHPLRESLLKATATCWQNAAAHFVISDEMGRALCERWKKRDYHLITDGVSAFADSPRRPPAARLAVYFMGMFHLSYESNLRALQSALEKVRQQMPGVDVTLTLRCGNIRSEAITSPELVRILPFADERTVADDIANADLLYFPLSFDPGHSAMAAFSLSTKMVTYLASGIPILYHGPSDAAAGSLLARESAAFHCNSLDTDQIAFTIQETLGNSRNQITQNALQLSKSRFNLENIRNLFWDTIKKHAESWPEQHSGVSST